MSSKEDRESDGVMGREWAGRKGGSVEDGGRVEEVGGDDIAEDSRKAGVRCWEGKTVEAELEHGDTEVGSGAFDTSGTFLAQGNGEGKAPGGSVGGEAGAGGVRWGAVSWFS